MLGETCGESLQSTRLGTKHFNRAKKCDFKARKANECDAIEPVADEWRGQETSPIELFTNDAAEDRESLPCQKKMSPTVASPTISDPVSTPARYTGADRYCHCVLGNFASQTVALRTHTRNWRKRRT